MELIRLIWDFRGPDSARTASHHEHHLEEYARAQQLEPGLTGMKTISDDYSLAYLVVKRDDMVAVRDALRPHRGEIHQ